MIYLSEGFHLNNVPVHFITLTELFNLFDNNGDHEQIRIQDTYDSHCLLKALPIHIEQNDRSLLTRLWQLNDILTSDVIINITTPISHEEYQLLKQTNSIIKISDLSIIDTSCTKEPPANIPLSPTHNLCVPRQCPSTYSVGFWIILPIFIVLMIAFLSIALSTATYDDAWYRCFSRWYTSSSEATS